MKTELILASCGDGEGRINGERETQDWENILKDVILIVANVLKARVLLRRGIIICWHILGAAVTYIAAYALRFDGQIDSQHWVLIAQTTPILVCLCVLVFAAFRLHSGLWSYFSVDDLIKVGLASLASTGLFAFTLYAMNGWAFNGFPRSVFALLFILLAIWASGGRLIVRYFREYRARRDNPEDAGDDRILLIGDLPDCDLMIRCARHSSMGEFVGVVSGYDKDDRFHLHGVTVYHSSLDEVGRIANETGATAILMLPPFNKPHQMNTIVESCSTAQVACHFRQVPSLADLACGDVKVSAIREVNIEDLLGRGEQKLDRTVVREELNAQNVMVTGAGGSIGSELCRQICSYRPNVLVLFELNEFALYTIEKDITEHYPDVKVIAFAGDIRHPEEVETAIELAGGIDILYHAAAYKHVPLMEANVPACFRNNVIGTQRLADVAALCHVKRFVMISSDKAVRPSNIMGATKRIAERAISERKPNGTTFVAVRFGNVLGSSGSVIPLFKRQIAAGGPVTVTSPNIRRFFMTIPEAVDLVLQAGAIGHRGEVMVLEMGEPVKIVDLANRLIELSGFVPGKDIKVEFTGLRPGEKEYEEVMTEDENVVRTPHDKIWAMKKNGREVGLPPVDIAKIEYLITTNDEAALRKLAVEYVPENTFPDDNPKRPAVSPAKTQDIALQQLGRMPRPDLTAQP